MTEVNHDAELKNPSFSNTISQKFSQHISKVQENITCHNCNLNNTYEFKKFGQIITCTFCNSNIGKYLKCNEESSDCDLFYLHTKNSEQYCILHCKKTPLRLNTRYIFNLLNKVFDEMTDDLLPVKSEFLMQKDEQILNLESKVKILEKKLILIQSKLIDLNIVNKIKSTPSMPSMPST